VHVFHSLGFEYVIGAKEGLERNSQCERARAADSLM
jgi:hypothetical protein